MRIAVAVAGALDYAHRHAVIHRDLKPENILLHEGQPLLADFGIALAVSKAGGQRVTESGLSLGTPQYMSPEQAAADRVIDGRSDIYSLGAVTYEMLTGDPPHTGNTAQAIISRVMTERPRPVRASRDTAPVHVEQAIEVALAKLPADRFGTAAEFADAMLGKGSALSSATLGQRFEITGAAVRRHSPARRRAVWAAAGLLTIAVGFALWKLAVALGTPAPKVFRLAVSIPASQGFVDVAGVSVQLTPDGRAIVYSGRGPRGSQLYYRRLDQMEGTPLPGTDNAWSPTISPTGDWVAFETASGRVSPLGSRTADISKVSVQGGAPVALGTVEYGAGISWGSGDAIFAGTHLGLFRVSANGGSPQQVTVADTAKHEAGHMLPMALPDGKTVLVWIRYPRSDNQPAVEKIATVRLADRTLRILEGEGMNPIGFVGGYLVFGRTDGTLGAVQFDPGRTQSVRTVIPVVDIPLSRSTGGMVAGLSAAGDLVYVRATNRSRLTFIDEQGRVLGGKDEERNFKNPRISPDGRRIVLTEQLLESSVYGDLWLYDVASSVMQRLTSGGRASAPGWTPDGRRVVFTFRPDQGPAEVWWVPVDGSAPAERLVATPMLVVQTVFSPDSRYVVVDGFAPKTKYDLYLVDLMGDRKAEAIVQSTFNETMPAISPNGRWLAYVSDESGREEVYVRPFPRGPSRVQVSAGGGSEPRWAQDANAIVYREANWFVKARLAIGAAVSVARRDSLFSGTYKSSGNAYIPLIPEFDVFANGTIVALRPGSADAEVIVVTNWIGELKAKLAKE